MVKSYRTEFYFRLLVFIGVFISLGSLRARDPQPPQGPIQIAVDLREAPRRIFHARLVIPAAPGPMTLVYPKWIPGEHGPVGPIADLTGIRFMARGQPLGWRRDDVDMYAFHCTVPAGADAIEVMLDYISPSSTGLRRDPPSGTAQLAVLQWNLVLLYPQGKKSDELIYTASLRIPPGWRFGTALPVAKEAAEGIEFRPVTLSTLVDSPVLTGAHFRVIPLSPEQTPSHQLNLAGDSAAAIAMSSELTSQYKQLVAEARALFGAHHYRRYEFLLALSEHVRPSGLEHHESSDNRARERALLDPDSFALFAGLLPHEFVHSWNGKYRRPAGLVTPDYQQPMKGELLWVYEGLTQYLGDILTARSGLRTLQAHRERLAWVAASLDHRPGRTWRPLADTAVAAQILYGTRTEGSAWRRGVDFYDESLLIWLEADTIIRRQTQGRSSLDDFCRRFFGGQSGAPAIAPYTFEDLLTTINQVASYDWRGFFTTRLNSTDARAPLGGITGSGWRLIYNEIPNAFVRAMEEQQDLTELSFSIGLHLRHKSGDKENGLILDVIPGMVAAQAGIGPGMKLIAVNGQAWSPKLLRDALREAKGNGKPIELLVENAGYFKTNALGYHDGERYPHLERDASRADLLEPILRPRAARSD